MPGDEPRPIVTLGEVDERQPEVLDRSEAPDPQQVLLQGANEALGDAISLGLAHERGRGLDSQASDFGLKILGHIIAPVIVTQLQPTGDFWSDRAEAAFHALPNRLQRLEPIG